MTFEDPHVARYKDPEFVERAPEGKTIKQMLLDGELDAAILGDCGRRRPDQASHSRSRGSRRRDWAKRHGGVPINHLMVIRESIAEEQPEVVKAVYRLLKDSREAASAIYDSGEANPLRYGVSNIRQSFDTIVDYALKQKLLTERVSADDVFARALNILGSAAE